MSECRDTDMGLRGEEGKRMEDSDVQQEDEEKAESTATDHAKPSGEENVDLPFQKPADNSPMTQGHDETHDDAISESKSGDSSNLQDTAASSAKVGEFKRENILFELQLTPSDVEEGRLLIPAEAAADYFPPVGDPEKAYKQKIEISDTRSEDWYMTLIYYPQEHAFLITNGWQEFVELHNLESMDVIRFNRPIPRSHDKHFLIQYVKKEEAETGNIPEFKQEKFMFELELTPRDVTFGRLIVPKEEVKSHFPAIKIPAAAHKLERMKFTDARNEDWCMTIIFYKDVDAYMIISGWERFVKEHNLQAMDVIKFYEPVQPSHARHFLIDYVKRKEAGTNLTQSGSARNDGNNGGGCDKGKEGTVGDEKPDPGGPENGSNGD